MSSANLDIIIACLLVLVAPLNVFSVFSFLFLHFTHSSQVIFPFSAFLFIYFFICVNTWFFTFTSP